MSLYRKYRPQTFADVVGQDHVVTTLENAAEIDRLSHAYLFAGSRGTGKTSVARILAKILMIRSIEDETLQKQIIKGVEEGNIIDLLEIDAASNRGIDDVRDLIEKIQFSPVVASAKVYIIDEAHMLTKEAFNALLKTLEEPPDYAHFILATTELSKVPTTIQSRCQCFPFHRIREEDIVRRLQFIADQEHIPIDREALRAIAHHVEGGLRDAISLLDQMRSLPKITLADVQQRIGGGGHEEIEAVFEALQKKDQRAVLEIVGRLEEAGVPLDVFLRQLLAVVRRNLHETAEKRKSTVYAAQVLDVLLRAIRDLRVSPVPGLVLESALLSLCTDQRATKDAPLLTVEADAMEIKKGKRKEKGEAEAVEEEPHGSSGASSSRADRAEEQGDIKGALIEAQDVTLESVQEHWSGIVRDATPAAVKMSLKNGRLQGVDGTTVTVTFSSAFHRDRVAKAEASHAVEKIMEKIFKRALRLQCVLEEEEQSRSEDSESVNVAEAAAEVF